MRIMIADPSGDRKRHACRVLSQIEGVTVVGTCSDLTACFDLVEHRPPNLVLIAPELTREHGFETMEVLFKCLSVRWATYLSENVLVVGEVVNRAQSMHNINLGGGVQSVSEALTKIMGDRGQPAPSAAGGIFRSTSRMLDDKIVMIGASTGGVDALIRVLGCFPIDCPPTLVVQHTGGGFSEGLARLLNQRVGPTVREARDGEVLSKGTVLIAPGSQYHLELDARNGMRCRLNPAPKISGHRPSVDALFASGTSIAKNVIGVILTGMGRDGADGLLSLKTSGSHTIGQDQATSVVFGMPGHAASIGAVEKSLPLLEIGPAILRSTQTRAA